MRTADQAIHEMLGRAIVTQRRLAVVARAIRDELVAGEMDYDKTLAYTREVRDVARNLVAEVATVEATLQPPLPGLGA